MQTDQYRTLAEPSEGLYKEKGSRFLAFAYPVMTQDECKELITAAEKKYHDARHHCYAWQLGPSESGAKYSDDGEPSGTAGKPIHGQILSAGLSNVLIVVVRYFGGIKLGTGGLFAAYKTAAADAIANGTVVEKTYQSVISIEYPYVVMNDVMKVMKSSSAEVLSQKFDMDCRITFTLRKSDVETLTGLLTAIEGLRLSVES